MPDRLDALEERLAAVEAQLAEQRTPSADGIFWALDTLKTLTENTTGAVLFTGTWQPQNDPEATVEPAAAEGVQWQYALTIDDIFDRDWAEPATPLAALGHPVRLQLLKSVVTGTTTTKELAEAEGLGTSGQLHHHLRTLVSSGWLRQLKRGDYEVPGPRIIPLLAILTATLD